MALLQPPVVAAPASDDVVVRLDEDLRVAVRRDGIDPQRDVPAVRRLATALVREHDERSLTGVVAPVADPEGLVAELVARVAGFGPLQPFLDDPTVEEVWINSPDRVFVARRGRHELTNLVLTEAQVAELVERMLKSTGRRIDLSRPFVDAMLPAGHRLHVVLQGVARGFSAVKTAVMKTTAIVRSYGTPARSSSSACYLRANQPRPHRASARRSEASRGVPRTMPVARLA
ncbi:ATPase, T2SS/T4P/T4SS family [Nocardioides carbamazepini]|uniref:ATPase, T2SS/T4P/T4SS family n=1 Tax=Nocardioides carbamazepini TaxID=2854259 RepID=UPI0021499E49|nr:ATPase, T2SS/T4P/T4SS family [Nocardioides carbamazepini]